MSKASGYIVLYDDEGGLALPMGAGPDCEGAIQAINDSIAVFPDRASARRAIAISAAKARLDEASGRAPNTDFTTGRKHLKVVPLIPWQPPKS